MRCRTETVAARDGVVHACKTRFARSQVALWLFCRPSSGKLLALWKGRRMAGEMMCHIAQDLRWEQQQDVAKVCAAHALRRSRVASHLSPAPAAAVRRPMKAG
ncbi:hypothetical protein VTI28DRAFT_7857 [Corynascus sepedonium]